MLRKLLPGGTVMLLLAQTLLADSLSIEVEKGPGNRYCGETPIRFELNLDSDTDSAELEFLFDGKPFFLNGGKKMILEKENPKKFTGLIEQLDDYFSPEIENGNVYEAKRFQITPVIFRSLTKKCLPGSVFPANLQLKNQIQLSGGVHQSSGKFGDSLSFDGKSGIALLQKIDFCPLEGCIEGWFYLPPGIPEREAVILNILSRNEKDWSCQKLHVYPNSRKLRYFCYHNKEKRRYRILSHELDAPEWIFFQMNFSTRENKMELFINGKSVGVSTYPIGHGGTRSRMTLGSVMLRGNAAAGCKVMLDDIRISNIMRTPEIPESSLQADAHTLLLMNFDGEKYLRTVTYKKRNH